MTRNEPDKTGFKVDVIRSSVTEASPEARTVLLKTGKYRIIRYQDRPGGTLKYFIINPDVDTLELACNFPVVRFEPRYTLGSIRNPLFVNDLSMITSLTLRCKDLTEFTPWVSRTMDNMVSLQKLTIKESYVDSGIKWPFRVCLNFVIFAPDLGPPFSLMSPVVLLHDGTRLHGPRAIEMEISRHRHPDIMDHILDIWKGLKNAQLQMDSFPEFVRLDISFWPENRKPYNPIDRYLTDI